MILPEEISLNTRIIVRFEVVGGLDSELHPYELEHDAMILVDSRRSITVISSPISNESNVYGVAVPLWINVTSTSTMSENYIINSKVPEGWQVVCLGILMNESGYPVNAVAGHIDPQEKFVSCDIHRLSGALAGQVEITVSSQDGALTWQDKQSLFFQEQISDSFAPSTELMVAGGLAMLVFIALIAVLIKKRTVEVDEVEIEEEVKIAIPVTTGPPISQVNGPPASPTPQISHTDQPSNAPTGPPQTEAFSTPEEIQTIEPISAGPPLPDSGLPVGWSMEQWNHDGQRYLDQHL
jgi:hypothetical protein